MYKDPFLWEEIRRKYYIEKTFKRAILRETGIHWETLKRILKNSFPIPYKRKAKGKTRPSMDDVVESAAKVILQYLPNVGKNSPLLEPLSLRLQQYGYCPNETIERNAPESVDYNWMRKLIQGIEKFPNAPDLLKNSKDRLSIFLNKASDGTLKDRNRAVAVLAHFRGIFCSRIAEFLCVSKMTVNRYLGKYENGGAEKLFDYSKLRSKIAQDAKTREMFFSILHSPPSTYNINRTTWKMADLRKVLEDPNMPLCKDVIQEIIRSEGYRWLKAKVVLTSNDPLFREKISRIKTSLSTLGANDRFFSIDEFGPFSIKMKPGRRLAAPNEAPTVPQFQKSKGFLIITAGLELSQNQITHFYSKKKDTEEMIRLLDLLLIKYKGCENIYLSWDAASWHISKKLQQKVDDANRVEFRLQ